MNDSVVGSLLQVFPFAGRLSPEASKAVRESASPQEFPAGAALLSEGQLCRSLLLVVRGAIRVFKAVPTGREITLYVVNPGESCLLGVSCLLTESRYPAQAATAKDTFAVAVPAPVFRRIFASDPEVQQFVIGLFSKRLAGVMTLVEEVAFRRMDERLAAFLLHASAKSAGLYHPVTMTHEEIAAHLGTAREVVSRLLSQFETDGLIALERRMVRIADPERLKRVARADPG